MNYKLLGKSGLRVSELALGTMTFGEDWGWGANMDESRKMFDAFAEAGGNFIDTADGYTNGTSEKLVGEFMASDRERFVLATKYSFCGKPGDPNAGGNHRKHMTPKTTVVWDCAAGSGQATLDLAERFDHVIASDASGDPIASAKAHPKIEYHVSTAEQSGLPDASVSLITVAQALHWFDLERFFTEAKRVLEPGGVLAVWAYGINQVEGEAVNQLVQEYYSSTVRPYWPPERKLVEDGYRSIPFPFDELPAPSFRMEAQWTMEQLIGYFSTWSATTRYIKATGKNPLEQLTADLARAWGDTALPRLIVWPLSLRVGHKQAQLHLNGHHFD